MEYTVEFPNPELANEDGLLAVGGDLTPEYLIAAYSNGIFPWFNEEHPILWWSPDPRLVLFPNEFKLSKSLSKTIKSGTFSYKTDHDFATVIKSCSLQPRKGQDGTWITNEMTEAYIKLHEIGIAHSFEVYKNNELCGGLYGVSLGKAFFGESMFHLVTDASKVALYNLVQWCLKNKFQFIDCQQPTEHLKSLGAREIPRSEFLLLLKQALKSKTIEGKWTKI